VGRGAARFFQGQASTPTSAPSWMRSGEEGVESDGKTLVRKTVDGSINGTSGATGFSCREPG